jgi:hypothetical protein
MLLQLIMIEERRWPLGNKVTELHAGVDRGLISCIKWKDTLIAWCNSESQVYVVLVILFLYQCTYL